MMLNNGHLMSPLTPTNLDRSAAPSVSTPSINFRNTTIQESVNVNPQQSPSAYQPIAFQSIASPLPYTKKPAPPFVQRDLQDYFSGLGMMGTISSVADKLNNSYVAHIKTGYA